MTAARHKAEFDLWLDEHGYGLSGRPSSPEGERRLRKLCARLNPYAIEYREMRRRMAAEQAEKSLPLSPSLTDGYAKNSFWDKPGQLVPVEECGSGKSLNYFGLHKEPRPENYIQPRQITRKTKP